MIEMKKVIVVSALAMAGVFSAQALADRGKTGFYVTGKAGASVVTQTDQRFRQDFGDDVYNIRAVIKTILYLVQALRWAMIFINITMFLCARKWNSMAAELQTPIIHWIHGILRWGMVVGKTHRTGSV
jgi:hypothetical protein